MDIFIKKLNFDFVTNQRILQLISHIDNFKGKWNIVEEKENRYLKELRKMATVESIGSSTRIEGALLTDEEIQSLLKNLKVTKLETRDEQEAIGYYEALELIYEHYSEIKISESYIKQLHQLLLKYSTKDQSHRGNYKNIANKIVATYPTGEQRVIFSTTEPALVPSEMQALIEWINEQLEEKKIHQLVITALFIYEFLSIHPFRDGNGRLSRLLTTLFLLQNEYAFIQYISFENHIEKNKKEYYEVLMAGQKNRGTENENIEMWLLFFLESLKLLTEKLEQKYDLFKSNGSYLNERQKKIMDFIAKNQPIKVSDITEHLPEININTLKKDLLYLREEQRLTMIGKGRGAVYINNKEE